MNLGWTPLRATDRGTGVAPARVAQAAFLGLLTLVIGSACAGPEPRVAETEPDAGAVVATQSHSLTGWFHIIWGEAPNYFVTDSAGVMTRLLLEESLAAPHGGTRALDRKRVRVTGTHVEADSPMLRVQEIVLLEGR